jgi:hypothetical protein
MKFKNSLVDLVLIGAASASLAIPPESCAAAQTASSEQGTSKNLERIGKQLRAEVEAKYKELKGVDSREGGTASKNGIDVTSIVLKYIPIGMSFDDAEAILRASGSRMKASPIPPPSGYIFTTFPLSAPFLSFAGIKCAVALRPQVAGDFSVVGEVTGTVITEYP